METKTALKIFAAGFVGTLVFGIAIGALLVAAFG